MARILMRWHWHAPPSLKKRFGHLAGLVDGDGVGASTEGAGYVVSAMPSVLVDTAKPLLMPVADVDDTVRRTSASTSAEQFIA